MYAQKGYWTLWVATLLFFAAFYTLIVPLPLYLTESGLPDWQVGVILGSLGIASLVARPIAGTVADGRGRRPVMLFGTGALVVGAVGITLTTRAPVLFGLRISQAIGCVAFSTAATALVADLVSLQHRGAAIARFGIAATLAMALTPAVVSAMLGVLTLSGAFWLCGVLAALAGALARRVQEPPREKKRFAWGGLLPVANKLRTPMMVAAMFGVGFGAFLQFLPLLTERRDLGVPGLTYTVYGIGIILTRLTAGRLLDGSKRRRMLPIAFLMLGVGLVGYAFSGSQAQLLVATLFISYRPTQKGPEMELSRSALVGWCLRQTM